MKFKELFDRAFPIDSSIREEIEKGLLIEGKIKKGLNIFYKIDLDLIKAENEKPQPEQPVQPPETQEVPVQEPIQQIPPEEPQIPSAQDVNQQSSLNNTTEIEPIEQPPSKPDLNYALSSVVTEEIIINDENKIIRKSERKFPINTNQANEIQSIDDILAALTKSKKSGVKIFDDFTSEIITLCINQNFNEIKSRLDKRSKIYFEIYYGKSKDDSIGIRFNKRPNSDTMTATMLLDNEIISAKFDIEKVNQKIIEYRNYEVKKS